MLGSDLSLESCLPLGARGLDDDDEEGVVSDSGLDKDDRDEVGDRVEVDDRDAVGDGGVYAVCGLKVDWGLQGGCCAGVVWCSNDDG